MDLESTLIRAEVLFKKFRRLVEAIDKKENFPTPRKVDNSNVISAVPTAHTRQSSSSSLPATRPEASSPSSSGPQQRQQPPRSPRRDNGKGKSSVPSPSPSSTLGSAKKEEDEKKRVITPELRTLLSRKIELVNNKN